MSSEPTGNDERGPGPAATNLEPPGPIVASGHSLKKNTVYALLGNGLLNLCRFGVVVLLAKFATAEVQGTFVYASIAVSAPVILFCGLELRAAFVADAGGEFTFGAYRALRTIGMGVAGLVLLPTVLWITRNEAGFALAWMMLAVCAGKIVFHLAEVYWGVYQRRERLDLMAWSNTLRGLTMLLPFAALFVWPVLSGQSLSERADPGHSMRVAAVAASVYVVAWAAIWWLFDQRLVVGRGDTNMSWNWLVLGRLARKTLPLGLVYLLINLCETVTHWFVKRAAGDEGWTDLGYFGAMRFITLGATFVVVQISTAAGNRLATYYQTDLRTFARLTAKLIAIAVGIGATILVVTWLFGEWFLRTVYTSRYAEHYPEFLLMVLAQAVVLLAVVFGSVTTHMRQFWIQVPVHLTVLAATVIAGVLLVGPENPIRGGAWTMLVRSGVQAILYLGCVMIGLRWRDRIVSA